MSRPKPTPTSIARRAKKKIIDDRARYAHHRTEIIKLLGGRCPCGYKDPRALQIDHRFGGGTKFRRLGGSWPRLHLDIKRHPSIYRLLCACCNAIARIELGQHRKPGTCRGVSTRKSTPKSTS